MPSQRSVLCMLWNCTLQGVTSMVCWKQAKAPVFIKACCLLGSMPNEVPDTCNGCNSAQSTDAQEEAKAKESTILESLESQLHIREQQIEPDSGSNNQQSADPGWSANVLTAVLMMRKFNPMVQTNVLQLHQWTPCRLEFSKSDPWAQFSNCTFRTVPYRQQCLIPQMKALQILLGDLRSASVPLMLSLQGLT